LTAQALLLLELILTVGEPTALFLLAVLTLHAHEPETAKFGLNLLFPSIFVFVIFGRGGRVVVVATRLAVCVLVLVEGVCPSARGAESVAIELEVAIIVRVIVAASVRGANGASGHGSAHVIGGRQLLSLTKRKHRRLLAVHQCVRKR